MTNGRIQNDIILDPQIVAKSPIVGDRSAIVSSSLHPTAERSSTISHDFEALAKQNDAPQWRIHTEQPGFLTLFLPLGIHVVEHRQNALFQLICEFGRG